LFSLTRARVYSPVRDPLHFDFGDEDKRYYNYISICESEKDDWKGGKLNYLQQKAQEDWHGKWVAEMARIAKPGSPVIIEQLSPRFCDAYQEWGGVHRDWWMDAARNNTYGWDVDPDSLVIEDDTLFHKESDRYHVFMLRRE
jgi:hypothetical protein